MKAYGRRPYDLCHCAYCRLYIRPGRGSRRMLPGLNYSRLFCDPECFRLFNQSRPHRDLP
ncbi:hypothetical protein LCGC14_2076770 [marine sediment metagenome]|uniref:MYM-type domain-containing protein n=1 Tax=marine sediment metagenome TaxID=412755 RepID=A0A0F9HDT6_9ZZZZ